MKSKSVTNLAEATADPAIDLDPIVPVPVVDVLPVHAVEPEGGALIGGLLDAGEGVPEQVDENAVN